MPDRWKLVTPAGEYELNATFAARAYEAGGVDGNAARRREDRREYQRSGDGLRTPGPLVLHGVVARDDQDPNVVVAELNDIWLAVADCSQVVRVTEAGVFTYDQLAGGPRPVFAPDGLGGWRVVIELWPGRASASFVPSGGGGDEPEPTSFYAWLETAGAATPSREERVERFNSDGSSAGVLARPPAGFSTEGEVHVTSDDPDTVLLIDTDAQEAHLVTGSTTHWTVGPTDLGDYRLNTGTLAPDGAALLIGFDTVAPGVDKQAALFTVTPAGTITTVAEYTSSDITALTLLDGSYYGRPIRCTLSLDKTVLQVLFTGHIHFADRPTGWLVGLDAATGAVLYQYELPSLRCDGLARFARVPNSDTLVVIGTDKQVVSNPDVLVGRYDFASGASNAPNEAWAIAVSAASQPRGIAVDATRVFASYDGGGNNVTCLSLASGSVLWTDEKVTTEAPYVGSLAAAGGRVLLGVAWDEVTFPTEEWGYVLLDAATGSRLTEGVFPLETWEVGPANT